jgi:hypothetical protein
MMQPFLHKRRILCIGVLNFSTTFGNLFGGQHFHTILCISIFVGCSIFAQQFVHSGYLLGANVLSQSLSLSLSLSN